MSKFARKGRPPPGFEVIAGTLEALEIELRESASADATRCFVCMFVTNRAFFRRTQR